MIDLIEELSGLTRALDDAGVPYALCGGLAMAVWGKPRATADIDLLVAAPDVERVMVDLSPQAITARLRQVEQLRRLCLALGKARPVVSAAGAPAPTDPPRPKTR